MNFILECDIQGMLPVIEFDIEFDRSIVEFIIDKEIFWFCVFMLIEKEGGIPDDIWFQFFDIDNELNFISTIDGCECYFCGIEFLII